MRKNFKNISWVLFILPLIASAQTTDNDTLRTSDVIIVKEFEPTISDAYKISEIPTIFDSIPLEKIESDFDFIPKRISTPFEITPISPARMKGEPLDKLNRAYFKGGYGLYNNHIAQLYINDLRSKTHNMGLRIDQFGSSGNNASLQNGFSETAAEFHGKQFYYNKILSGNLGYKRDAINYYGINPEVLARIDLAKGFDPGQVYHTGTGNIKFKSYYKDSSLVNFDFDVDYHLLQNRIGNQEDNIDFKMKLDRYYSEYQVVLDAEFDWNNFRGTSFQNQNIIAKVKPEVVASGNDYVVRLGLAANANIDNITNYYFYPQVYAKYNLVQDLLIPYIGLKGGLERNSYKSITSENPFVMNAPQLRNTSVAYDVYGGVRGEFSSNSSFNLHASKSRVDNKAIFVNNSANILESDFELVYDTVNVTNLTAEFGLNKIDRLNLALKGSYNIFDMTRELSPWHMPAFEAMFTGTYDLQDKILLRADFFYISKQYARTYNPMEGKDLGYGVYAKELKGLVDINIGAEYRYTKQLSFFLDMYNMANMRYNRYNNYPTQGFGIMGGLTYSFWEK